MRKYLFYHCILLLLLFEVAYNWGVYATYFHSVTLCKGYKGRNITDNVIKIHFDPVADTTYLNGYSTNRKDGGVVMARIRFWKWSEKAERFEFLVTFNADNVCDYPAIKKNCFDKCYLMDAKCNVVKGTKLINNLDLERVGHYFMGESFFHGKFKVMMDFFTAKENVTCFSVVVELMDTEKLKEYRKSMSEKDKELAKMSA